MCSTTARRSPKGRPRQCETIPPSSKPIWDTTTSARPDRKAHTFLEAGNHCSSRGLPGGHRSLGVPASPGAAFDHRCFRQPSDQKLQPPDEVRLRGEAGDRREHSLGEHEAEKRIVGQFENDQPGECWALAKRRPRRTEELPQIVIGVLVRLVRPSQVRQNAPGSLWKGKEGLGGLGRPPRTQRCEALACVDEGRRVARGDLIAADDHVDIERVEFDAAADAAGLLGRDERRA